MFSRSSSVSLPGSPDGPFAHDGSWSHITPERLASTRCRMHECSSLQLAGSSPPGPTAPFTPPKGSPRVPSQCRGSVLRRPRTGMVVRGSSSPLQVPVSVVKKQAPPIAQSSWSVLPSGWQLSQEKLPWSDAKAFMNAIRPLRTFSGVGSLPTVALLTSVGVVGSLTSTVETVLSSVFST